MAYSLLGLLVCFVMWYISLAISAFWISWPGYYNLSFLFLFAEVSPSQIPISLIFIYSTLWELSDAGFSCDLLILIHVPGQGDGTNLTSPLPLSFSTPLIIKSFFQLLPQFLAEVFLLAFFSLLIHLPLALSNHTERSRISPVYGQPQSSLWH